MKRPVLSALLFVFTVALAVSAHGQLVCEADTSIRMHPPLKVVPIEAKEGIIHAPSIVAGARRALPGSESGFDVAITPASGSPGAPLVVAIADDGTVTTHPLSDKVR
jgi:hypothetical protein